MVTFLGYLSPEKASLKVMTQLKTFICLLPTQDEGLCVSEGSYVQKRPSELILLTAFIAWLENI